MCLNVRLNDLRSWECLDFDCMSRKEGCADLKTVSLQLSVIDTLILTSL